MKRLAPLALLLSPLGPSPAAQTAVTLVPGPGGPDAFGEAVDFVDLGARSLVLVGAPGDASAGPGAGRVYLVRALGGAVVQTLDGAPGQRFGRALAALGDTDGDGQPEIAVGAPNAPLGSPSPGAVQVFGLGSTAPLLTVSGLGPAERIGSVLDALGDVNGDGAGDFLAGSVELGGVRVYDGATGAVLHATLGVPGFRSASAVGDLDGDGAGDYAVAAEAVGPSVEVRSGKSGSLLARLGAFALQQSALDGFSSDLGSTGATGAGDADLDGTPDLAVGLPGDNTAGIDAGRVSIYSGLSGAELHRVLGAGVGQGFGYLLAAGGDADLDGHADVLESPFFVPSEIQGLSGRTGAALFAFVPGAGLVAGYASALAPARDVTGDGRPEFLFGDAALQQVRLYSPADLPLDSDEEFLYLSPQPLELDAGPAHANEVYFLVGSASGTLPGIDLGGTVLPLNPDAYLLHTATHPGEPPLVSSLGVLDAAGRASAQLDYAPELKGLSLHHAFLTFAPGGAIAFASNPLPVIAY